MRPRVLWLAALLFSAGAGPSAAPNDLSRLQELVDELKGRLSIRSHVIVTIVPDNALLVSVEPLQDNPSAFTMSFEDGFVDGLADNELRAVIAHELGHVWIFTHHPYLQTERLANDVAMRIVTRESLQHVYTRIWAREGAKGDLARFISDQ